MRLLVKVDDSVPRFDCDECCKCTSKIAKSLCKFKNRGCCFYYPKFNLVDLQRMSKHSTGRSVLKRIIEKNTKIFNYYIQVIGYFDENGYNNFKNLNNNTSKKDAYEPDDNSIYFKACPFVIDGTGCSIPHQYRTPICNFFLCKEVKNRINSKKLLYAYEEASRAYYRYYEWENQNLIELLEEKGLTLKDNFDEVIDFLSEIESYEYEFPSLQDFYKDA
ncbi:hypothetical protein ACEE21_09375 [Clostridium baratii]|uniref:hypothetical protein n=1 Tax=Clostridium baratii TaxID=1561 RepID=UPI002A753632|nr:hypothetical protein [Clostridium baratii]MDY3206791.1 hypothetical protein [Clostridium baratii]